MFPIIGAIRHAAHSAPSAARAGAYRAGAAIRGQGRAAAQTATRVAQAAKRRADPNTRFDDAWRMNANGSLQRVSEPGSATPPEDARRGTFSREEIRNQLRAGATVRFHDDRTASLWGGTPAPAPAPAPPSVPDATLAAMRAQRPARPRRDRPAHPARTRAATGTTSPARYFSTTDPSKHFGD
jgi:hypothetical protein